MLYKYAINICCSLEEDSSTPLRCGRNGREIDDNGMRIEITNLDE